MYEVQLEKVTKAEEDKNKAMHEIAEFLTKQIEELADNGIIIHDEDEAEMTMSGFTWDEEEKTLKVQFDY